MLTCAICTAFVAFARATLPPEPSQPTGQHHHGHNSSHVHHPSSVCIVTMANKYAKQRYADALRSHRCYAKRHGYTYSQEELREGLAHPTLQKPMAVQKWVDDARCKWVAWFDADFFVVQGERGLDEWLYRDASLVIKDDHTIINNAAFILRAPCQMQRQNFSSRALAQQALWRAWTHVKLLFVRRRLLVGVYSVHEGVGHRDGDGQVAVD